MVTATSLLVAGLAMGMECFPSTPADEARLNALYVSSTQEWPAWGRREDAAVDGFLDPLKAGGAVSLMAYFSADGFPAIVLIRGDADRVESACAALRSRELYRWPLAASRPFSLCTGIHVARREQSSEFTVRTSGVPVILCAGESLPLRVTLENVSGIAQQWPWLSGGVEEYLTISDGRDQIIRRGAIPSREITPGAFGPGEILTGMLDLGQYSYMDGRMLTETLGEHSVRVRLVINGQGDLFWTGMAAAEVLRFQVVQCKAVEP